VISLCLTTRANAANDESDSTRKSHGLGAFCPPRGIQRAVNDVWKQITVDGP